MDDIYVAKIETDSFTDSQQQFLPTSGEVTRTSRGCDEGEGGNLYGNITSYACLAGASFTDPSLIIFFQYFAISATFVAQKISRLLG